MRSRWPSLAVINDAAQPSSVINEDGSRPTRCHEPDGQHEQPYSEGTSLRPRGAAGEARGTVEPRRDQASCVMLRYPSPHEIALHQSYEFAAAPHA